MSSIPNFYPVDEGPCFFDGWDEEPKKKRGRPPKSRTSSLLCPECLKLGNGYHSDVFDDGNTIHMQIVDRGQSGTLVLECSQCGHTECVEELDASNVPVPGR